MSKKTRKLTNKAGKLMKCDGQMLKKVIEAKGYKCHELSKMLRYCSDYLTTCCRTNKISDVAAKYLMDYKIFPQMYDLEGEIKVEEPKEVKIEQDYIAHYGVKGMHWGIRRYQDENGRLTAAGKEHYGKGNSDRDCIRSPFAPTAQEVKKVLNEKYGVLGKGVEGIDYGYGPAPKNPSYYAAGHTIAKGLFQLMHAAMDDLKHDPEFKEMIKQAVKEAYEEL